MTTRDALTDTMRRTEARRETATQPAERLVPAVWK